MYCLVLCCSFVGNDGQGRLSDARVNEDIISQQYLAIYQLFRNWRCNNVIEYLYHNVLMYECAVSRVCCDVCMCCECSVSCVYPPLWTSSYCMCNVHVAAQLGIQV